MSLRQDVFRWLNRWYIESNSLDYDSREVHTFFPKKAYNSIKTYCHQWKKEKLEKIKKKYISDISHQSKMINDAVIVNETLNPPPSQQPPHPLPPKKHVEIPKALQLIATYTNQCAQIYENWTPKHTMDVLKDEHLFFSKHEDALPFMDADPRFDLLGRDCKQRDLYLSALYHSVFVVGVRGTAKTTSLEDAIVTKIIKYRENEEKPDPLKISIFSGKQDTAAKRVIAIRKLLMKKHYPKNQFLKKNSRTIELKNGIEVSAHALTPADISSNRAHIIWLDEAQFIPRDIFDVLVPLFSGKTDTQLWISGNALEADGSAFESIATEDDREDFLDLFDMREYWFEESDIYWTNDTDKEKVRKGLEICGTENAVNKEMSNQFVRKEGTYYPHDMIKDAYTHYNHDDIPSIELFDEVICGVDWGDTHDTTFSIIGGLDHQIWELETIYLYHADNSKLMHTFYRILREYPNIRFAWETSPMGAFVRNEIRNHHPEFRSLNSSFTKRKSRYIDNLYIYLVDRDIFLKDPKLRGQLQNYCGDKKNDDGHDALCHALYHIYKPRTVMKTSISVI